MTTTWVKTVRAVLAICCTYVYFLLFAQFGFLQLVQTFPAESMLPIMGTMAFFGIAASLATGQLLATWSAGNTARLGFAISLLAAVLSPVATGLASALAVAAAIGAGTGMTTVAVATWLPTLVPGCRLGRVVGVGTGMAYLVANVPCLFAGSTTVKAFTVAGFAVVGLLTTIAAHPESVTRSLPAENGPSTGSIGLFIAALTGFLGLIWFDSAAFVVVQQTMELKGETWGNADQQWRQGSVHLLAAVAAGVIVDRGRLRGLLPATFVLFATAFGMLSNMEGSHGPLPAVLYAIGISLYSVALVACPGWPGGVGRVPVRWRAALLFGIAGWFGSTQGIGMARHLHRVPILFVILCGIAVLGAWAWSNRTMRQLAFGMPRFFGVGAALLIGALLLGSRAMPAREHVDPVAAGHGVYIAEGCIHCHSQYERPGADTAIWGPVADAALTGQPVLIGNRRQGPDLSHVGVRRSPAWQRLHLRQPSQLTAGSRMPSYAHLFAGQDPRGEQLVAYLASLGKPDQEACFARVTEWQPPAAVVPSGDGALLFQQNCAACHGVAGRGDGPMAGQLPMRPADLTGTLRFAPAVAGSNWQRGQVMRIIRFGIAGTEMPGHETLPIQQLAALADYVQGLSRTITTTAQK